MKLYQYVHCPFCVRVRFGLKFLKVSYTTQVVAYDDIKTPTDLIGKKMLPIFIFDDKKAMPESLDILKTLDTQNQLKWEILSETSEITELIETIGSHVHNLAMPYWIWTPEFNESSRQYFQAKKEEKRGPFKELVKNQAGFIRKLQAFLDEKIEPHVDLFYKNNHFSIVDIMIASHLWGMYVVPEFQFSPKVHAYLQRIKALTGFNYHEDLW